MVARNMYRPIDPIGLNIPLPDQAKAASFDVVGVPAADFPKTAIFMRPQNRPAKAKVLNMHTKPIKRPFDKCLQESCRENQLARDGPVNRPIAARGTAPGAVTFRSYTGNCIERLALRPKRAQSLALTLAHLRLFGLDLSLAAEFAFRVCLCSTNGGIRPMVTVYRS